MWNVLSLYRTGTLQNLTELMQEYKIDLLAVQEVRWLGRSIIEKDFRIYCSCDDKKKYFWSRLYLFLFILLLVNISDQE